MSKRHQSNRRKTYGRRQHEVAERRTREPQPESFDASSDDLVPGGAVERFLFLDPQMSRLRYALGD